MRRLALASLLLLTACADWPDVPASEFAGTTNWPRLVPLDAIATAPEDPERDEANQTLVARAASLRARADLLRRPVEDDAAMERLRQSLDT